MKITIKNIIRWEQLTGKPFGAFDTADEGDITALMYVTTPTSDTGYSSYEDYADAIRRAPQVVEDHVKEVNRYLAYMGQFNTPDKEEEADPMALPRDEKEAPTCISDVAMNLLYSGVNADYLMNDAELCDLKMLGHGAEENVHRRMEEQRLWTYLGLSPYLDKNCKGATDFYPFPWEEQGKPKPVTEDDMQMAEAILGGKEAQHG